MGKDTTQREEILKDDLERRLQDITHKVDHLPADFEARINEVRLETRDLRKLNEILEKQLEGVQREISMYAARAQRKSLGELVRERERILAALNSSGGLSK